MKLKIGIGLQVVVLAGIIIGLVLPWYQIKNKEFLVSGKWVNVEYKWKDMSCQIEDEDKVTAKYNDDTWGNIIGLSTCITAAGVLVPYGMDHIEKILNSCLSFLVIGGALALGTALLQVILLVSPKLCRSCIWKLLCIGCAIAATVMLFISFFTLLGLPKAFKEDTAIEGACEDRWCDKIIGNDDDYRWIPGPGWWATLAATFTSFVAAIFTLASNR